MTTQQWTIGSDSDADLTVIDPTVSRKHCRLSKTDKGYFVEDLVSRNGTFVDGERVVKRTPVTPKSKIIMAESVPMPWPDESLARQTIRIGRHIDNDLVLDHESVSTHHAVLMCDVHGRWLVRDLNSTNGTSIGTPYKRIRSAYVAPDMPLEFGSVGATLDQWLETIAERRAAMTAAASPNGLLGRDMATVPGSRVGMPSKRSRVTTSSSQTLPWLADRKWIVPAAILTSVLLVGGLWMFWPKGNAGQSPVVSLSDAEAGTPKVTTPPPPPPPKENPPVAPEFPQPKTPAEPVQPQPDPAAAATTTGQSQSQKLPVVGPEPVIEPKPVAEPKTPVTAMERLRAAMVLIVTTDRDGQAYRHSSGLAVGPHSVLTTGVASEDQQLGEGFDPPQVLHVASGKVYTVQKQIPSLKLTEALTAYQLASNKRKEMQKAAGGVPPSETVQQEMKQLAFSEIMYGQLVRVHDVGLLVTAEALPNFVDGSSLEKTWMAPPDTSPPALTSLRLIGPFFADDGRAMFDEKPQISTQSVKPLKLLPRVSPSMRRLMLAKIPGGLTLDQNFGGCMIVDSTDRVVGMFSRERDLKNSQVDETISKAMSGDDLLFDMISTEVLFEFLNSQLPSS